MNSMRWTAEQVAAIQARGHTMLSANAGTGKTTTVVGRILWRLGFDIGVHRDTGAPLKPCPPDDRITVDQIAAITFTEKAAYDLEKKLRSELRARDPKLLRELNRAYVGTIHGFCGELLKEHALRFGIDPVFRVLDERESRLELDAIIRDELMQALERDDRDVVHLVKRYTMDGYTFAKGAVGFTELAVRELRWHKYRYGQWLDQGELDRAVLEQLVAAWDQDDTVVADYCSGLVRVARAVITRWYEFLREENARDFDALILDCRDALSGSEGGPAINGIRRRFRLLIIDEFQDTDAAQRDVAFVLAGVGGSTTDADPAPPELFVVGDPKQSIYRFRGADVSVWNQVRMTLCGDKAPLELTLNFRSDPVVVDHINRVAAPMMTAAAEALQRSVRESAVEYSTLEKGREATKAGAVEWLAAEGRNRTVRIPLEAKMVASRIRDIVIDPDQGDLKGEDIVDPDTEKLRLCRYRDVAILLRSRTSVGEFVEELEHYGIPYYLAGDVGLADRLEILDCLTALKVIHNPRDDLTAFAFLRSPFVGLRDETIARLRFEGRGSTLLRRARSMLDKDWFPAPEHDDIVDIEKKALTRAIDVIEELNGLKSRLPIDQLLEIALDRLGYRLHFILGSQYEAKLANIERFLTLLAGYRTHTLGTFLELWSQWENVDLGIPQAALYSKQDDVVTISTVHGAKGLEWPVVFLVDIDKQGVALHGRFWSDRAYGPIVCPPKDDRGPRANLLVDRETEEEAAEEARLTYVALTRARDRLYIAGPEAPKYERARWLARGVDDSVTVVREVPEVEIPEPPPEPSLGWISEVAQETSASTLMSPLAEPSLKPARSATELMMKRNRRAEWLLLYQHGVRPVWRFAPESGAGGVPANVRGTIIHGVLERIQEEAELAELLDVTVGALDQPELEEQLAVGTAYREQLEQEIRGVLQGEEWQWYVDGEHYRELQFVHLLHSGKWRVGALDLYRPGSPNLVIDFKTQDITTQEAAEKEAEKYAIQGAVYRAAVGKLAGEVEARLHFTRGNVVVGV